jgi:hypothetical protein
MTVNPDFSHWDKIERRGFSVSPLLFVQSGSVDKILYLTARLESNPQLNNLPGGQQFGPFTSRNLTPDPGTGRPANLTFDQFLHVLRIGEDLDHAPPIVPGPQDLLQVMPWVEFGKMSTRDIRAIYEYLRAIPSRPTCV